MIKMSFFVTLKIALIEKELEIIFSRAKLLFKFNGTEYINFLTSLYILFILWHLNSKCDTICEKGP